MINFNDATEENIKEHNANWSQIPHYPSFNLIDHQPGLNKIYLQDKDGNKAKYQFLINNKKVQD